MEKMRWPNRDKRSLSERMAAADKDLRAAPDAQQLVL